MRILVVFNEYKQKGGEEVVVQNELELLNRFGDRAHLYKVSNDSIQSPWDVLQTAKNVAYSNKYYQQFSRELQKFKPDVVHVHNFFPLLTPSIFDAAFERDIPSVMTLHNYRLICASSNLSREGEPCERCITGSAYQGALAGCYRQSRAASFPVAYMIQKHRRLNTWNRKIDRFIALTRFSKSRFLKAGFDEDRIAVKPNFMEDPLVKCPLENSQKELSGIFVGRLSGEKGIDTLLDAWRGLDVPLKIIGDGPMLASVQERLKDPTLQNVRILGEFETSDVFEELRRSSFLVVPSHCYETFSMATLEAFAHGLPVVASKIGSLAEVVHDDFNGFHFEPRNAEALRRKIQLWIENPTLLETMSENARATYLTYYTPEQNHRLLKKIYQSLLPEDFSSYSRPNRENVRAIRPEILKNDTRHVTETPSPVLPN